MLFFIEKIFFFSRHKLIHFDDFWCYILKENDLIDLVTLGISYILRVCQWGPKKTEQSFGEVGKYFAPQILKVNLNESASLKGLIGTLII